MCTGQTLLLIPTGIRYDIPNSGNLIRPDLSFFTTKSFGDVIQYASTLNGDGFKLSNFTNTTIDEFMVLNGALEQTPIYTAFIEETIGSGLKKNRASEETRVNI